VKALLFALVLVTPAAAQLCGRSDALYFNGNILTGKDLLTAHPQRVKALITDQGTIVYAGDDPEIYALCPGAVKIDLHGAFVMPGFNDAHTHIAFAGQQKLSVDLDNVPSLAEMQAKIKAYAATLAPGQWILGGGWDHTKWASKTLPTRQELDAVTGDHPAYLERTDGHIAILNTAALSAAGFTKKTPAPQGGAIDLDPETHELTGIVRDAALSLVAPHIPKPDAAMRRKALTVALNDASANGVTSVQDFSEYEDFQVLEAMEDEGQLHVRVAEWMPFDLPIDKLKQYQALRPSTDLWLHTTMLKGFMDGSLGSRTAALFKPYSDDPKNSGLPRYDQKKLNAMTTERAEAGFQIGFHAIGDRANSMALTAFDIAKTERMKKLQSLLPQLQASVGAHITVTDTSRYRIEHAQVLAPGDFDRFAKLHIIASMQPSHLLTDMAWADDRLGPERSKYAYAWKSFLDHGVTLAFGTDYPVESINPFRGLYSSITRRNEAGTQTFQPQEKITLNQAIYAYTQGSAFAENAETLKGLLAPGFVADFIVLDRDITAATPQDLLHTKVLRTVAGGKTVYLAP
jgi:predicted amidohydrolase YtcJ